MEQVISDKKSVRNSKWLAIVSLCLIILGIYVVFTSVLNLCQGETHLSKQIKKDLSGFGYESEQLETMSKGLANHTWRIMLPEIIVLFLVGFLMITSGIGLFCFKKWAWWTAFSIGILPFVFLACVLMYLVYLVSTLGAIEYEPSTINDLVVGILTIGLSLGLVIYLLRIRREYFSICDSKLNKLALGDQGDTSHGG